MRFLDCVNSNVFENYWYLDGCSDRLGYCRYTEVKISGNSVEIERAPKISPNWTLTAMTIVKLISLMTIVIPAIMLAGKMMYRLSHVFVLSKGPLSNNERISIGTYNILFPQRLVNGTPAKFSTNVGFSKDITGNVYENSAWRTGLIAKNILKADLDIVCLQEVTDDMGQKLRGKLKDHYCMKWVKHARFHGVGILYKKDQFSVIRDQTLSLDIEVEDSSQPGSYHLAQRAHLLHDLRDKTTQRIHRVVSCHMFDPRSLKDKQEQTTRVIQFAEKRPGSYDIDRIVIAGDMNQDQFGDVKFPYQGPSPSEEHATSFQPFIANHYHVDGNLDSTEYEKKQADNGKITSKNRHIDWIWVKDFKPDHLPLSSFDIRGSDHALVASTIC